MKFILKVLKNLGTFFNILKMKNKVAFLITICILSYIGVCFIELESNFLLWSKKFRIIYVVVNLIDAFIVLIDEKEW